MGAMDEDKGRSGGFEDALRAMADEIKRNLERVSDTDAEDLARAAGVEPERVREWVENAGEWLRRQAEGRFEPPRPAPRHEEKPGGPMRSPGDDVLRGAGPHPLDVPTPEQGAALAALQSGRWTIEPGTQALSAHGEGPGPSDALGLVRELRARDWIDADGQVTLVGVAATGRWLKASAR